MLSQSGLSLERLASFCDVAAAGGLTKAAGGDPARQSLFSRQIKELEGFFGAKLIRRQGRGIALTDAGVELHEIARRSLASLTDFRASRTQSRTRVTLAAGDSLLRWVALPRLSQVGGQMPEVNWHALNLPTAAIRKRLEDGTADIALVREAGVSEAWVVGVLGTMDYSLFLPKSLAGGRPVRRRSAMLLAQLPMAVLEGGGSFRLELERLAIQAGHKINTKVELPSFPLVAQAIAGGAYAGVLPSAAATELLAIGAVELKLKVLASLRRRIVLACNPRMVEARPLLKRAVDLASEVFRFG